MAELITQSDVAPGVIVYEKVSGLDVSQPRVLPAFQDEDLVQVEYPSGAVLDVGYYGDKDSGVFSVVVIRAHNWEEPCFRAVSARLEHLRRIIQLAHAYIEETDDLHNSQR